VKRDLSLDILTAFLFNYPDFSIAVHGPGGAGMKKEPDPFYQGLSYAARIGVELVSATLVGTGLGLIADRFLKTFPWFLVIGVLLGAAAGFLNIIRFVNRRQKEEENSTTTR
jgi:F0F1-type ATP synthase assembly protein I